MKYSILLVALLSFSGFAQVSPECYGDEIIFSQIECTEINMHDNPNDALGAPNYVSLSNFNSTSLGEGGFIIIQFNDNILSNSGDDQDDLYVYEIGPSTEAIRVGLRPINLETENILVDAGLIPIDFGNTSFGNYYDFGIISGGISAIDIDSFLNNICPLYLQFDAVLIEDIVTDDCNTNEWTGADIDAICALTSYGGIVDCLGCTYPMACNFSPLAVVENGSCEFESCSGCTYPLADNYVPEARIDDGSCIYDCQEDLNNDGVINTGDLNSILAMYGSLCP